MWVRNRLVFLPVFLLLVFAGGLACRGAPKKKAAYRLQQVQNVAKEVRGWKMLRNPGRAEPSWLILKADELMLVRGTAEKTIALPPRFVGWVVSRQGRFFALFNLAAQKKSGGGKTVLQAGVYSAEGRLLYRLHRPKAYDEPVPARVLSDRDGTLVLGESATARLFFFGPDGRLLREVTLFPDAEYDLERLLQIDVSADGRRVAVLAGRRGASPLDAGVPNPSGEPHVFLFDADGNLLWQRRLQGGAPQNVALSPDGEFLLASSYSSYSDGRLERSTALLRRDGTVVRTLPVLFRSAAFAPQAGAVLLADRSAARLIRLSSGEALWQVRYSRKAGMVAAAGLSPEADRAFVLTARNAFEKDRFVFKQPVLHVIDRSGSLVQELTFPQEAFLTPSLTVASGRIFLGLIHKLYRIEVQR